MRTSTTTATTNTTTSTLNQTLCDNNDISQVVFELTGGATDYAIVWSNGIPAGISVTASNTGSSVSLTISGTPIFNSDTYSFSVFTSDGNANCSQVSQTVTLTKNSNSPSLSVVTGSDIIYIKLYEIKLN